MTFFNTRSPLNVISSATCVRLAAPLPNPLRPRTTPPRTTSQQSLRPNVPSVCRLAPSSSDELSRRQRLLPPPVCDPSRSAQWRLTLCVTRPAPSRGVSLRQGRGARAVFQFYPENSSQVVMITSQAMKAGFTGGLVVDYPNSTKAKKMFLVLMTGGAQPMPEALGDDAPANTVAYTKRWVRGASDAGRRTGANRRGHSCCPVWWGGGRGERAQLGDFRFRDTCIGTLSHLAATLQVDRRPTA